MDQDKSISNKLWIEKKVDNNIIQRLSQNKSISEIFSKLLLSRGVNENNLNSFLYPDILSDIPNPFELKDMKKGVDRCIISLLKNEKIGIIADYDVDGSTSASILFKFLNNFNFALK